MRTVIGERDEGSIYKIRILVLHFSSALTIFLTSSSMGVKIVTGTLRFLAASTTS